MRARRFLLANLAVVLLLAALVALFVLWRSDPDRVDRSLPLFLPEVVVRGAAGEAVRAGTLVVTVEPLWRAPSLERAEGLRLGARARPERTRDYVALRLTLRNDGPEAMSLDWIGQGQRAELWLGTRRPTPRALAPVTPQEAALLAAAPALPDATLPPGGTLAGVVVFPVSRAARELSVLLLPAMLPSGRRSDEGPPAVEVTLPL